MQFLIDNFVLILIALTSGGLLLWPMVTQGGGAAGVQPTDAVQLINREKAVVVDVSSAEEYASGHVLGAKHVPLDKLEDQLPRTVKNKALPLILVCPSGIRSRRGVAVAKKLGYERVLTLTGGLAAWRAASLPTEKG
ncbi:MAG: rhodanese-like domain-containing protein [Serpentinimonas sp.]|nr:rhodanese-like domain-containing protein [Serpentinimonas sp.]